MNANRLINMVLRVVLRRLLRGGINTGLGTTGAPAEHGAPPGPEGRKAAQHARRMLRMTRRIGRF